MKTLTLILVLGIQINGLAQDCPLYQKYIDLGERKIAKPNYQNAYTDAINAFRTAMLHCPAKSEDAQARILKAFNIINKLKEKAEKQTRIAKRAENALRESLKAEREAQIAKEIAQREMDDAFQKLKDNEEAFKLHIIANEIIKENPTIALRIEQEVINKSKTPYFEETAQKIYNENEFYKIISRQASKIANIIYSPDGKTILNGAYNGKVSIIDLEGNILKEFKAHNNIIELVVFSNDGKKILTCSDDSTAKMWDLEGNLLQTFIGHTGAIYSVAFSPDNKNILTGSDDNSAILWDLDGKIIRKFIKNGHTNGVSAVAFIPPTDDNPIGGKTIVTGSLDSTAILWNINGDTLRSLKKHKDGIGLLAFSPDGNFVLTGSWDNTAILWDLKGKVINQYSGHTGRISTVAFSPDSRMFLTGSVDKTARLWHINGELLKEFKGHDNVISSVAYAPDGKTIATGSIDSTIRIWDLKSSSLWEFGGFEESNLQAVSFSHDGKKILTINEKSNHREPIYFSNAVLTDLKGKVLDKFKMNTANISSISYSPKGNSILTYSEFNEKAILWNLKGDSLATFEHKDEVTNVTFSPDGTTILSSTDFEVYLWDINGNKLQNLNEQNNRISSVAYFPDGKSILTIERDSIACFWQIDEAIFKKTNKKIQVPKRISQLAISTDGKSMITSSGDPIARLVDLNTGKIKEFKGHSISIYSVAFSPNGKTVLTGSDDGTARLWDLDGHLIKQFSGNGTYSISVSYSKDGNFILTGYKEAARLWEFPNSSLGEFLINGNLEPLTDEQKIKYGIIK